MKKVFVTILVLSVLIIAFPFFIENNKQMTSVLRERKSDYKTVKIGNDVMTYREYGKGRPLIIIHGYMNSSIVWDKNIESLVKNGYHVYAVDLFGHGMSDKPAGAPYTISFYSKQIIEFMNQTGIKTADFIGHSMGGAVTIKTACEKPEAVQRMVLIGSAGGYVVGRNSFFHRLAKIPFLGEFFLQIAMKDITLEVSKSVSLRPDHKFTDDYKERYFEPFRTKGFVEMAMRIARSTDNDEWFQEACLKKIESKTLIIHGTKDKVIKYDSAEVIRKHVKNSVLVTIEGAPHNLMESDSDIINSELDKFLTLK